MATSRPTDGANLVLRLAHVGRMSKLAAPSALVEDGDKGADVETGVTVIVRVEGSVHYLDVGDKYVALRGLTACEHSFSRHNFITGQKGHGRDSSGDI